MAREVEVTDRFAPTPAFLERILGGREMAEAGDLAGAEALFLDALSSVRGRRDGDEMWALRSLITLYGRAGRYFESLILSRRLADRARIPGAAAHLVFAYGGICGSLNCLYLPELLETELHEMEALLSLVSGDERDSLEKEYHESSAGRAQHADDADAMRTHVDGFRKVMEREASPTPLDRWIATMNEAEIALLEGDPQRALLALEQVEEQKLTPRDHRLHGIPCWIRTYIALGDVTRATERAHEGLALLEEIERDSFRCSDLIHQGARIAQLMAADLEMPEAARHAYDLVAAAVVLRIAQLDEAVRHLPELGSADAAYAEELISHRKRFVTEQRTLMARVAELMHDRQLIRDRLGKEMPEDFIAICAWCERVRPEPDRWIPVGHFVPRNAGLRITHTLCPTCAQRMV